MKKTFQKASLNVCHKQEAVFPCIESDLKKPARNKKSVLENRLDFSGKTGYRQKYNWEN